MLNHVHELPFAVVFGMASRIQVRCAAELDEYTYGFAPFAVGVA